MVTGYRSISIREETYRRLERIAKVEGFTSIAEAVSHIVKYYEEKVLPAKSDPLLLLVARMLGLKNLDEVIDFYSPHSTYPMVYLCIGYSYENGKLTIYPEIALNPIAILNSYCNSRACREDLVEEDVSTGIRRMEKRLEELKPKLEKLKKMLEKFNVIVETEPRYVVKPYGELIK